MSDTKELLRRLQHADDWCDAETGEDHTERVGDLCGEAKAKIESQAEEIERLTVELKQSQSREQMAFDAIARLKK